MSLIEIPWWGRRVITFRNSKETIILHTWDFLHMWSLRIILVLESLQSQDLHD